MSTTTFRKVRFPMLIGGGIIAAGILIYFSNGYINSQKTQGAIGQRDVYRDGEVKAADVAATPGAAPVAMTALLQTKEYQSLAKNPAFTALLADSSFVAMTQNAAFQLLVHDATFVQMVAALNQRMSAEDRKKMSAESQSQMIAQLRAQMSASSNASLQTQQALNQLANNVNFGSLVSNVHFRALAADQSFANLLNSAVFERAMANASASLTVR